MNNKTRLELSFEKLRHQIAELVSPPYTGEPEQYEKIKPSLDRVREAFLSELLCDENEAIEFFSRNRIEMEWCFAEMMKHFKSENVYNAVYDYYARNFPSRTSEEIELIIKQKCGL